MIEPQRTYCFARILTREKILYAYRTKGAATLL